jgi:hypothetical protein
VEKGGEMKDEVSLVEREGERRQREERENNK